ncbi:MAG: RnfABCDGE type electron transport complex subunit B [Thermodesulfobacteriota bacterium]|nr:MAG: RnfABCDGE type electron transport complex subunit B [Thermodesulfobacteriota bacterium]
MSTGIILASAVSMGGIGAALAAFLAFADRKFHVKEDPRIEKIVDILPGTNCGGCGHPGCRMLAEALLKGEEPPTACVAGGNDTAVKLAGILGVEVGDTKRTIAVVLCKGGNAEAVRTAEYRGALDCTAANLTGGGKACVYGCLGYGECVDACNFDAMAMDDNGLPVVFHDKCVGCGACARACPRDIIELHPEDHKLFVYCKNRDKGAKAKKVCTVACIGCGLCTKDCSVEGGIVMKNNLAEVNYDLAPQNDESTKRCPTKCILFGIEESVTREAFLSKHRQKAG